MILTQAETLEVWREHGIEPVLPYLFELTTKADTIRIIKACKELANR